MVEVDTGGAGAAGEFVGTEEVFVFGGGFIEVAAGIELHGGDEVVDMGVVFGGAVVPGGGERIGDELGEETHHDVALVVGFFADEHAAFGEDRGAFGEEVIDAGDVVEDAAEEDERDGAGGDEVDVFGQQNAEIDAGGGDRELGELSPGDAAEGGGGIGGQEMADSGLRGQAGGHEAGAAADLEDWGALGVAVGVEEGE